MPISDLLSIERGEPTPEEEEDEYHRRREQIQMNPRRKQQPNSMIETPVRLSKEPSPAAHNRKPGHHRVVSTAAGIQKAGRESEEHSEEGMGHADHTKKMASNYPPSNSLKSKSLKIQKGGNLTYEEHVASKKPYKLVVDRSKKPEEEARRVQSRLGHHRRREIEEEEEREEENRPQIEHRDILMELDDEIFRTLDHEQFGILSARSKEVNQLVTVIRKCTHPRLTRYSNPADRPGARHNDRQLQDRKNARQGRVWEGEFGDAQAGAQARRDKIDEQAVPERRALQEEGHAGGRDPEAHSPPERR